MPRLIIDLDKIEANARVVAKMLAPFGTRLVGVTKACLGNWHVAGAMLDGGAAGLADSRAAGIDRLRRHLPLSELQLLRAQPGESWTSTPDLVLVSSAAQAGSVLAGRGGRAGPTRFCLMIETGDGREGIPPDQAGAEAVRIEALPGASLAGAATNTACASNASSLKQPLEDFRKAASTVEKVVESAARVRQHTSPSVPAVISAGGSGLLALLADGGGDRWLRDMFGWLSDLRCGEALLLGNIPRGGGAVGPLPGAQRDAFVLEAPVLEVADKAGRRQVLAGLGLAEIGAGEVTAIGHDLRAVQVTSDYLTLECRPGSAPPGVGDRVSFIPSYYALLGAMTSPLVEKEFRGGLEEEG